MAPQNQKIYPVRVPMSIFITLVTIIISGLGFIVNEHLSANASLRADVNAIEVYVNELNSNQKLIIADDERCVFRQRENEAKVKAHGLRLRELERKLFGAQIDLKECQRILQK